VCVCRCGKTGVATTFINRDANETTLLDLKHILMEVQYVCCVCVCVYDVCCCVCVCACVRI